MATIKLWVMVKNVVVISFGFTLLFTGFSAISNLQSSVNKFVGIMSLLVINLTFIISTLFLPSLIIRKLTAKWTMPLCMLCYSTYIAAQFYPTYYTLLPAGFLVGLAAAPLWASKCTYITEISKIYADHVKEAQEVITTRFFGIFFFIINMAKIWGNLTASIVLADVSDNTTRTDELLEVCGAQFCPANIMNLTSLPPVQGTEDEEDRSGILFLSILFLVLSLISPCFVAYFVDPLTKFGAGKSDVEESGKDLLWATLNHLKKLDQILLVPLTVLSGVQKAFISADFTMAFITCSIGVHMVGYMMICISVFEAVFSMLISPIVKCVGRVLVFILAALLNAAILIVLLVWHPQENQTVILLVISAIWGICDAVWQTQVNVMYAVMFPEESKAAFSNYHLWKSIGYMMAFLMSGLLCIDVKVYVIAGLLFTGMASYLYLEMRKKSEDLMLNDEHV